MPGGTGNGDCSHTALFVVIVDRNLSVMGIKTGDSAGVNVISAAVMGKGCHRKQVLWKQQHGIAIAVPQSAGRPEGTSYAHSGACPEMPTAACQGSSPAPNIKISRKEDSEEVKG